jgi:adenosylmethionine-8-amino-7-oxononanoate aminotransferase
MAPTTITEPTMSNDEPSTFSVKKEILGTSLVDGHTKGKIPSSEIKPLGFQMERDLKKAFPVINGGKGNYLHLADGRKVFDASSGAAVSCIGHGDQRVIDAITRQLSSGTPYLCSTYWSSDIAQELCKELIEGTGNQMSRVYLTGSGQC